MPDADKVACFIHDHEPEEREYKCDDPAPMLKDSVPAFEPAPPPENLAIALPATQPFSQPIAQPAPACAPSSSNQIPYYPSYAQQLAHYGLDQYAPQFTQDTPYGLFPDNLAGCTLPPPDYMLDANNFDVATGAPVDELHLFLTDEATFNAIMAQVQDATAVNLVPQSDQAAGSTSANNPPTPGPSNSS
ncbi:hypothetical protein FRC08_000207 [Ceratobasidium sp. 394]|nr:hypothetical protein FRC08_000207 [Ceratobasidium sp. 394]